MKKTSLAQLEWVLQVDQESRKWAPIRPFSSFSTANHDKLNLVMEHMQVYVDKVPVSPVREVRL